MDVAIDTYSPLEEKINIYSHVLGMVFGLACLPLLVQKSFEQESFSFILYGLSIVMMFFSSVFYHSTKKIESRFRRKVLDHCAIYLLIAGTYTPLSLVAISGSTGLTIFVTIWILALTGILFKLFFTGRFKVFSTIMYILMGGLILIFWSDLFHSLRLVGVYWLLGGGLLYSIGAIIYLIKRIHLNHAIFHLFVLGGCFSHFMAVYYFVP